jgi:hypothetical protein
MSEVKLRSFLIWTLAVRFWLLYSQRKTMLHPMGGGWVGLRADLGAVTRRKTLSLPEIEPSSPSSNEPLSYYFLD